MSAAEEVAKRHDWAAGLAKIQQLTPRTDEGIHKAKEMNKPAVEQKNERKRKAIIESLFRVRNHKRKRAAASVSTSSNSDDPVQSEVVKAGKSFNILVDFWDRVKGTESARKVDERVKAGMAYNMLVKFGIL
ncbi:hypothetical protein HK097_001243 [Rhizophlyctis rosea]|uniref:Uncharacterized protein n=1 Tax=Rhizophlyctis rosea TaxID=64517 RepID=A0AAD5SHR1_9FUNG|nr:hypothetical protein HK097_001243 [Rhizophlyctis rosea]